MIASDLLKRLAICMVLGMPLAAPAAEPSERNQLVAKLTEVERCVDGHGSCRELVGQSGVLLMRSFPSNIAGARGTEQLFLIDRQRMDSRGVVPVQHEVPISFSKEFESLAVGKIAWPERTGRLGDDARCFVDAQGKFCPAIRDRNMLRDLIRDARASVAPSQSDFQIVRLSDREWLLSKWATSYSGFPMGSYMVLSRVGKDWQVSALVVLL